MFKSQPRNSPSAMGRPGSAFFECCPHARLKDHNRSAIHNKGRGSENQLFNR